MSQQTTREFIKAAITSAAQQDNPTTKTKRGPRDYVPSVKPATLSLPGLMKYLDRSKNWIYEAMNKFDFPRPINPGGKKSNLWLTSEIDGWIESQRARRDLTTTEGA